MRIIFLSFLFIIIGHSSASAEEFDNQSIVTLTEVGVGDDVILTKIDTLPCSYDVSTGAIISLKESGVSNEVIAAMVARCVGSSTAQGVGDAKSDPTVMRAPGIYYDDGDATSHDLQRIRPSKGNGGRVTGNGSILFPFKAKINISRSEAQTKTNSKLPNFYFYFEPADLKVGDFGTSGTVAAQSPSEFTLVELKVRKGNREIISAKMKAFSGVNVGLDPDKAIQFQSEELKTGVFRVVPDKELEAGEYAFVLRSGSDTYRFYDFSVLEAE